jgi:type VI secretion system protein ImpK
MMITPGRSATNRTGSAKHASREQHALVDAFCEYHAVVITQKRLVIAAEGKMAHTAVQQHLLDAFEELGTRVGPTLSEHERRAFDDARYVMIAMADEVFCRLDWEGKEEWVNKPLEAVIFYTRDSGERFFTRIDSVLKGETSASSQLLRVYLTALALGFRGRYAPLGTGEPETYRSRIADYLARMDPDMVRGEELCPQAHEFTASGLSPQRLPSFSRGLLPFVVILIAWVVLGEIIWIYRTADLSDVLDRIEGGT